MVCRCYCSNWKGERIFGLARPDEYQDCGTDLQKQGPLLSIIQNNDMNCKFYSLCSGCGQAQRIWLYWKISSLFTKWRL